jgi:hypothetical protein
MNGGRKETKKSFNCWNFLTFVSGVIELGTKIAFQKYLRGYYNNPKLNADGNFGNF